METYHVNCDWDYREKEDREGDSPANVRIHVPYPAECQNTHRREYYASHSQRCAELDDKKKCTPYLPRQSTETVQERLLLVRRQDNCELRYEYGRASPQKQVEPTPKIR